MTPTPPPEGTTEPRWFPANGLDYSDGVDCQPANEWCHYQEAHEHGGFACDTTCPCRAGLAGHTGPKVEATR